MKSPFIVGVENIAKNLLPVSMVSRAISPAFVHVSASDSPATRNRTSKSPDRICQPKPNWSPVLPTPAPVAVTSIPFDTTTTTVVTAGLPTSCGAYGRTVKPTLVFVAIMFAGIAASLTLLIRIQ